MAIFSEDNVVAIHALSRDHMTNRNRNFLHIAALLSWSVALLFPLRLSAEELASPSEQLPQTDVMNVLDKPRDYLSDKFVGLVSDVDRFFGDERHYQEANDSVFQLDLTHISGYGGNNNFVLSGRAKLHLPVTEQRFHLLLETDPDKNVAEGQSPTPPITQTTTTQSIAAALRFAKAEKDRWQFSTDAGLKFHGINASPFARTRASLSVPMDQWRGYVAQSLFWFDTTGIGENTHLDLDRSISGSLLFRASSNATWLKNMENFDLRQDLSLFQTLDERTALLYQASAVGVSKPYPQATDYILLLLYRYRLHHDWTFFELSPQLHFPKEKNFQSSPALTMRLEILFDESK